MFFEIGFIAYKEIQNKNQISNWKYYINQVLWYKKRLNIEKEPFFKRSWYENNIIYMYVNNLLKEQGNVISLNTLQLKFNIKTNHVTVLGHKHAMISNKRKCNISRDDNCLDKPFIPININSSVTTRKEYIRILSQFLISIVPIYSG